MRGVGRRGTGLAAVAVVVGLGLGFGLAGCDGSRPGGGTSRSAVSGPATGSVEGSGGVVTATAPDRAVASTAPGAVSADRAVVRTASLQVRVGGDGDVLAASRRATAIAVGAGGFVAGENTTGDPGHPAQAASQLVLRVPNARLGPVLDQLVSLGALLQQRQDATDVTGQVVDLDARLASQRASVERVRALLARAATIGDVVQIEGELARREADLEALEAQVKQLADQTALATVTLTLVGPAAPPPAEPRPAGFLGGLAAGWHALTTAAAWTLTALGVALPFLVAVVLLAAVVLVGLRLGARRRHPTSA